MNAGSITFVETTSYRRMLTIKMKQGKKFISPGMWFSMIYSSDWNEFKDKENCFLFYNPDVWTGNFRISAYKKEADLPDAINYGHESVEQELKENPSAVPVRIGAFDCAYSQESYQEDDDVYTTHLWIVGIENMAFECSFSVPQNGEKEEAEEVIASLEVRKDGVKYPAEVIPVRLSEIYVIDEGYKWVVNTVKTQLKKSFQGVEGDLVNLQAMVESDIIGPKKREQWLAVGIAICVILNNEIDGFEWKTLIDGNREVPVLQYKGEQCVDPMKLTWSKVKTGGKCNVLESYQSVLV